MARLTAAERRKLKPSDFVYPAEKRYPIHDLVHGRAALSMVAKNGSDAEIKKVQSAVYKRYPKLDPKNKEKRRSASMNDMIRSAAGR